MNANFGTRQLQLQISPQCLTKSYELGIFKSVNLSEAWFALLIKTGTKIYAHRKVLKIKIFNQHLPNAYQMTSGGSDKDGGADVDGDKDDGGDIVKVTGNDERDGGDGMMVMTMTGMVTDNDKDNGDGGSDSS